MVSERELLLDAEKNLTSLTRRNDIIIKPSGNRWKLEALNEMVNLYKKHQDELSWIGGNFNQTVKRANELANNGELNQSYFDKVLSLRLERYRN
jgi:hypothetical protein